MTEEQARRIAEALVIEKSLAPCKFFEIRKFLQTEHPKLDGDKWVVDFKFDDEEDVSPCYAMVIVDDATGSAYIFDSL